MIGGLEVVDRGLGYYAKREHPVEKQSANLPAVDVAWKADKQQEFPLRGFSGGIGSREYDGEQCDSLSLVGPHIHKTTA